MTTEMQNLQKFLKHSKKVKKHLTAKAAPLIILLKSNSTKF